MKKKYGYTIEVGTPVIAAKINKDGSLELEPKKTTKEVTYKSEDLVIDPLCSSNVPDEAYFASRGFFGFKLPNNSKGYDMIICHGKNLTV